jgi:hypothetical protein
MQRRLNLKQETAFMLYLAFVTAYWHGRPIRMIYSSEAEANAKFANIVKASNNLKVV